MGIAKSEICMEKLLSRLCSVIIHVYRGGYLIVQLIFKLVIFACFFLRFVFVIVPTFHGLTFSRWVTFDKLCLVSPCHTMRRLVLWKVCVYFILSVTKEDRVSRLRWVCSLWLLPSLLHFLFLPIFQLGNCFGSAKLKLHIATTVDMLFIILLQHYSLYRLS